MALKLGTPHRLTGLPNITTLDINMMKTVQLHPEDTLGFYFEGLPIRLQLYFLS